MISALQTSRSSLLWRSLPLCRSKTRDMLMPESDTLFSICTTSWVNIEKTGRRPTYEYALIGGINDSENELGALRDFCRGTLALLILFN